MRLRSKIALAATGFAVLGLTLCIRFGAVARARCRFAYSVSMKLPSSPALRGVSYALCINDTDAQQHIQWPECFAYDFTPVPYLEGRSFGMEVMGDGRFWDVGPDEIFGSDLVKRLGVSRRPWLSREERYCGYSVLVVRAEFADGGIAHATGPIPDPDDSRYIVVTFPEPLTTSRPVVGGPVTNP